VVPVLVVVEVPRIRAAALPDAPVRADCLAEPVCHAGVARQGDRDRAPRRRDPAHLAHGALRVGEVVQHAGEEHPVERSISVGQVLRISHLERDPWIARHEIHVAVVGHEIARVGVLDETAVLAEVAPQLEDTGVGRQWAELALQRPVAALDVPPAGAFALQFSVEPRTE
jgi:hypothetical protein